MGKDKALLPFRGGTLAGHVAALVETAAGSVRLVGDPGKYGHLGYAVLADRWPGAGPLGGIETALSETDADWNFIVACDMPRISVEFLSGLLAAAAEAGCDALVPIGFEGRPEPLSAVYHRRCLATVRRALENGVRKVTEALASLDVTTLAVSDAGCFENLNTPEDWACYQ